MCRFTAYVGPARSPRLLVFGGTHSLLRQSYWPRELLSGHVNADGFGVVWYGADGPVRLAREVPVWQDADLEGLLASVRAEVAMAALRNVTPGVPYGPSGVPPVVMGRWSFALNGYLPHFRRRFMRTVHGWLPDDLHAELTGVSDTEALGLVAVDAARTGGSVADALRRVVERVRELVAGGEGAQLNMALSDGVAVAVTRASTGPEPNSLHVARSWPVAGGAVVASEALDDSDAWEPVPAQSVVELSPSGVTVEAV